MTAARRASGLQPVVHVATAASIDRCIRKFYYGEASPQSATASPLFTVTRNTMEQAQQKIGESMQQMQQSTQRAAD